MVDNLKPEDRKKTMRAVKGKGTSLERRLFSTLAGMKIRGWNKNPIDIEGKPDVVFRSERIAIFIDGCFWHGCPICNRKIPETNKEYWITKISKNINLANVHNKKLTLEGWMVIRIWEHEMNDKISLGQFKDVLRNSIKERKHKT